MKKIAQAMCAIVLTLLTFMIVPMNSALADVTCHNIDGTAFPSGDCVDINGFVIPGCTQCEFTVLDEELVDKPVCLEYASLEPYETTVTETWNYYDPLPQEHKLTGNFTTPTRVYHTKCSRPDVQSILFTEFSGNPNVDVRRVDCYPQPKFSSKKLNPENLKVTPFSLTPINRTKELHFDSNLPNKRLTCKNLDNKYEASVMEYNCGFDLDIAPRSGYKTQKDYCTSSAITTFSMKPTYTKEVKCRLIEKSFDLGIDF